MLYLAKSTLVQRMKCCHSREQQEKQYHVGMFVVQDLLLAFVMRYNFTQHVFQWTRLVRLCNMNDEIQLTIAFARVRAAVKISMHHFPTSIPSESVRDELNELGMPPPLKLRAAAETVTLRRHTNSSDDDERAVACFSKLSDDEFLQLVAEVAGPLKDMQVIQRVQCL